MKKTDWTGEEEETSGSAGNVEDEKVREDETALHPRLEQRALSNFMS